MYNLQFSWLTSEGIDIVIERLRQEQQALSAAVEKLMLYTDDIAKMESAARKYTMFRNALIFDLQNFASVSSPEHQERFGKLVNELVGEAYVAEDYFRRAFEKQNLETPSLYFLDTPESIPVRVDYHNKSISFTHKMELDVEDIVHALDYMTREKCAESRRIDIAKRAVSIYKSCENYAILYPLKKAANRLPLTVEDIELSDTATKAMQTLSQYVQKTQTGYSVQLAEFEGINPVVTHDTDAYQRPMETIAQMQDKDLLETLTDKVKQHSFAAYVSRKYEFDEALNDITDKSNYATYQRYWDNERVQRINGRTGMPDENGEYFLIRVRPNVMQMWADAAATIVQNKFFENPKECWYELKRAVKATFGKWDKMLVMDTNSKRIRADITDLYTGEISKLPKEKRPAVVQRIRENQDYHLELTELFRAQKGIANTWRKQISPVYALSLEMEALNPDELNAFAQNIVKYCRSLKKKPKEYKDKKMSANERIIYGLMTDADEFTKYYNHIAVKQDKADARMYQFLGQLIYTGKEEFTANMESFDYRFSPEVERLINLMAYENKDMPAIEFAPLELERV